MKVMRIVIQSSCERSSDTMRKINIKENAFNRWRVPFWRKFDCKCCKMVFSDTREVKRITHYNHATAMTEHQLTRTVLTNPSIVQACQ